MSNAFKIAHIRQQGVDLIIVPLDEAFGRKNETEQHEIIAALQIAASSAGLAGTVVPMWLNGGRTKFIAPQPWHPFFRGLGWNQLLANCNRVLTIS